MPSLDKPSLEIAAFCKDVQQDDAGIHQPVGVFDSLRVKRSSKKPVVIRLDTYLVIGCEPGRHVLGLAFRDPDGQLLPEMYRIEKTIGSKADAFPVQTEIAIEVAQSGLYRMEIDFDLDVIGEVPIRLSLVNPPQVH